VSKAGLLLAIDATSIQTLAWQPVGHVTEPTGGRGEF